MLLEDAWQSSFVLTAGPRLVLRFSTPLANIGRGALLLGNATPDGVWPTQEVSLEFGSAISCLGTAGFASCDIPVFPDAASGGCFAQLRVQFLSQPVRTAGKRLSRTQFALVCAVSLARMSSLDVEETPRYS